MPLSSGYRGVRFANEYSWHKRENLIPPSVCAAPTGEDLIMAGLWSGAMPVKLGGVQLFSSPASGSLISPVDGIMATYADGRCQLVGAGSQTVNASAIPTIIRAVYASGLATPTGIFCMRDGSRVCATFALKASGTSTLRTHLVICDDFASKMKFSLGASSVDVLCDNTWASALASDGHRWAFVRHTSSFDANVAIIAARIGEAIQAGDNVRTMYEDAKRAVASQEALKKAFNVLYPKAPEGATQQLTTRANNKREEMKAALRLPGNVRGLPDGSVAKFAHAATFLVNHTLDGQARRSRGCELESELTGTRAERTQEILEQIQILMADGSTKEVSRSQAVSEFGVPVNQALGCSVMDLDVSPS